MVGRNGAAYLRQVYSVEARFCLVLVSHSYEQSTWAQLAKESMQARKFRSENSTLIPIRVDNYLLPGYPKRESILTL